MLLLFRLFFFKNARRPVLQGRLRFFHRPDKK